MTTTPQDQDQLNRLRAIVQATDQQQQDQPAQQADEAAAASIEAQPAPPKPTAWEVRYASMLRRRAIEAGEDPPPRPVYRRKAEYTPGQLTDPKRPLSDYFGKKRRK